MLHQSQLPVENTMSNTTLPTFQVNIVYQHANQFQHINTTLNDYIQEKNTGLILYFYPKDNTSACSVQAEDFSQHFTSIEQLGYTVLGVSRDSLKSHEKFIINKNINFGLISDNEQQLCDYFNIIGEKMMYGKKVQGVIRSTLIFDKSGNLQTEFRNVKAKGHIDTVLNFLKNQS